MADFDLSPTGLRQLALSSYTDALQYNLNAIDRNKIKIALVEALASVQISQELNEIKHILREQKHDQDDSRNDRGSRASDRTLALSHLPKPEATFMTNAQKVTFHAVKEIIHAMPLRVSEPEPLHDKEYASVVFELQRSLDTPMKFLIEADGCLARIYA